jgi:hypothetical protein
VVVKRNDILQPMGEPGKWIWYYDQSLNHDVQPATRILKQEATTFGHPGYRHLAGGGDNGGPWLSRKEWYEPADNPVSVQGLGRAYIGTVHLFGPYFTDAVLDLSQKSDFYSLASAGATAISRTIPTNPVSGAAVFVGELREGLPHIVGSGLLKERTKLLKNMKGKKDLLDRGFRNRRPHRDPTRFVSSSGSEYLNVQFGWVPMMSDLRKFARSVKDQNKIIRQLHKDSGRLVRRRYHFPTEETVNQFGGNLQPTMVDGSPLDSFFFNGPTGLTDITQTWTRKRWFSGAYEFYLPPADSGVVDKIMSYEAEANKLLGLRLTPEVVWELAPWSWAVDWFSNVGNVLTNASAFSRDGLVLRYGYMMEETSFRSEVKLRIPMFRLGGEPFFHDVKEALGSTTKYRQYALPYGFNVDLGSLSPRQLAITAALGANRGGRVANLP